MPEQSQTMAYTTRETVNGLVRTSESYGARTNKEGIYKRQKLEQIDAKNIKRL